MGREGERERERERERENIRIPIHTKENKQTIKYPDKSKEPKTITATNVQKHPTDRDTVDGSLRLPQLFFAVPASLVCRKHRLSNLHGQHQRCFHFAGLTDYHRLA